MVACPTCGRLVDDLKLHGAEMTARKERWGALWQLEGLKNQYRPTDRDDIVAGDGRHDQDDQEGA